MLREFSLAYTALPAQKFETVGTVTDPVVLRYCLCDGKSYFYIVNREYYPVKVEVQFSQQPTELIDLATAEPIATQKVFSVTLGAYELKSFSAESPLEISGFKATVPQDIADSLIQQGKNAIQCMDSVRDSGKIIIGMDGMEKQIKEAIGLRRFAWLRRALTSYIVRKAISLG